tara:strand:+ start:213 stop:428 length:216 start_codon:yes stop_codon:yes gene_type:complete
MKKSLVEKIEKVGADLIKNPTDLIKPKVLTRILGLYVELKKNSAPGDCGDLMEKRALEDIKAYVTGKDYKP